MGSRGTWTPRGTIPFGAPPVHNLSKASLPSGSPGPLHSAAPSLGLGEFVREAMCPKMRPALASGGFRPLQTPTQPERTARPEASLMPPVWVGLGERMSLDSKGGWFPGGVGAPSSTPAPPHAGPGFASNENGFRSYI